MTKSDQLIIRSHMCNYIKVPSHSSIRESPCLCTVDGLPTYAVKTSRVDTSRYRLWLSFVPTINITSFYYFQAKRRWIQLFLF